jgi:hypothetical protein
MVALGPVIPLYLNPDMVNNLFSILIQEFIEAKSVSNKKQVVVNIKTPLSEFSFDIWGRYVQGELNIQTLEEFIRQRAEENISASIIALKRLTDILGEQNLLKHIDDKSKISSVNQGDFVDFDCSLNENPVFSHAHNTIKMLEASKCCYTPPGKGGQDQANSPNYNDILASLKNGLNECRSSKCIRYVSDTILDSDSKAVVPVEAKNMLVNNDYMLNGKVHILGKVTRTNNYGGSVSVSNITGTNGAAGTASTAGTAGGGSASTAGAAGAAGATAAGISPVGAGIGVGGTTFGGLNLLSGTYFDYLNYEQFNNLGGGSLINTPVFSNLGGDIFNPSYPLLEVLPIAIFI